MKDAVHQGATTLLRMRQVHALVLDGVYRTTGEGVTVFHPAPALTGEQLPALLDKIIARILRVLTRQGHLVEEEGLTYVANAHGILDPENLLAPLQAASCTYRIAFGPRAGRKVLSWQYAARRAAPTTPTAVRLRSRIQPACGGALRRRATPGARAPVPLHHPPRDRQRAGEREPRRTGGAQAEDGLSRWHEPPRDVAAGIHATAGRPGAAHAPGAATRMSWARLLKRVFDIDIERCPQCGGNLKIIAADRRASGDRAHTHASGVVRAAAATGSGASRGYFSGGLSLEYGLVLARADGNSYTPSSPRSRHHHLVTSNRHSCPVAGGRSRCRSMAS